MRISDEREKRILLSSIAILRALYYNLGKGKTSMNKPYHERPDWILKSIVYFCDNYTIDGKDLRKFKREAIQTFREKMQTCIIGHGAISEMPGFEFWDCLYWLQGGLDPFNCQWGIPSIGVKCSPWTDYEKRKIAKMPRVK
jgi:hypothetical protein